MMTLYSVIQNSALNWPDKIAVISGEHKLTFCQLKFFIDRQIKMFKKKKIIGQNILLQFENSIEYIIAFFAVACSRNTVVLCDIKLNQEIQDIVIENNVHLVLTSLKEYDRFHKKIASFSGVPELEVQSLSIDEDGFDYVINDNYAYSDKELSSSMDIALILYTSGSTSFPKGVINTHQNLMEALRNYTTTIRANDEDVFMGVVPFIHSYALGSCMLTSICSGACLIIQHQFDVKRCLKSIEDYKVTIFHGVPYMYSLFNRQFNLKKYNLNNVRLFISAGMKLDAEIFDTFFKLTSKIIKQEYGSTETGTVLLNFSNDINIAKLSVGKPLNGVDILIDSADGIRNYGVLLVHSKGCGKSYVGMKPFGNGYYRTSDIVSINEDSYVLIHGRVDRLINIEGKKVDPCEVERILCMHPYVKDASVYSIKCDKTNVIKADIICNENVLHNAEEIKEFCSRYLSTYKIPRIIRFCSEFTKTSLGKKSHYNTM